MANRLVYAPEQEGYWAVDDARFYGARPKSEVWRAAESPGSGRQGTVSQIAQTLGPYADYYLAQARQRKIMKGVLIGGGVLAVGAGILLLIRKRMAAKRDEEE